MIDKIKFVWRYISYLLKAKYRNGHGLHSPFIYNFAIEVLFNKDFKRDFDFIEKYRKELLKDDKFVEFKDFGAGSKALKTSKRKIADIAKFSSTRKKYGQLLARMIKYYQPQFVLELGSSLGVGSLYLTKFLEPTASLITVEGDSKIADIAQKKLGSLSNKKVQLINAKFEQILPKLIDKHNHFDFIFFDGNHTKHATIDYFEQCVRKVANHSIFVFDDIHWSGEMENAWEYIQSHSKTKVCIDLFQFGIVFFGSELTKQNYIIRF